MFAAVTLDRVDVGWWLLKSGAWRRALLYLDAMAPMAAGRAAHCQMSACNGTDGQQHPSSHILLSVSHIAGRHLAICCHVTYGWDVQGWWRTE